MTTRVKAVDSLTPVDFEGHRVWEYRRGRGGVDTYVRQVKRTPVTNLTGRRVATRQDLANGDRRWALVGNVDPTNPRLNKHFVTISIEDSGRWFHLARYHDHDYAARGPSQLARFLRLSQEAVFPIRYDLRPE